MPHAATKIGLALMPFLALPIAACAAVDDDQAAATPLTADRAVFANPANTHAQTFEYGYTLKPITEAGYTIIAKYLTDGSRWAAFEGNWYNIDAAPQIVPLIATSALHNPDADYAKTPTPGTKAYRQYEIDLDYYAASLKLRAP